MSTEDLKKSVQSWKEIVDTNAFSDSVGVFAESTVSASPIIDKASTWAAAGVAAVAGLAITNIDKMTEVYGDLEVRWLFSLLAISIFFAIVQKYLAISCAASLHVVDEIKRNLPNVLSIYEEHEKQIEDISKKHNLGIKAEFDFLKVLNAYINLFPKWTQFIYKSRFERVIKDRNYAHQKLVRLFIYQSISALIQYLAILVFICLAAVFI